MSLREWAEHGGTSTDETSLAEWSESQRETRAMLALFRLSLLPPWPKKPHRVVVPFPYQEREEIYGDFDSKDIKERIEHARDHIFPFPLSWITAIQHSVEPERVAEYILNPQMAEVGLRHTKHGGLVDHPIVVRANGVNALYDGHHRCTAAKLLGDFAIPVRLVDLE